jgi:hypothetical protein
VEFLEAIVAMSIWRQWLSKIQRPAIVVLVVLFANSVYAIQQAQDDESGSEEVRQKPFTIQVDHLIGTKHPVVVEVTPGLQKEPGDDEGMVPTRVCISGASPDSCYVAQDSRFQYAQDVHISVLHADAEHDGLFFRASFEAINDTITLVALLGVNDQGQLANLHPGLYYTLQGHYHIWSNKKVAAGSLITLAEHVMDIDRETHFSEHRYKIVTYSFCPEQKCYIQMDGFTTRKKYEGLDGEDHPAELVLKALMPIVRRRLLRADRTRTKCGPAPGSGSSYTQPRVK